MSEQEWTEELSRDYTRYMEKNLRYDTRPWARRIAADCSDLPAGAAVLDVAGGPAFLLLELAPLLPSPRLLLADFAPTMIKLGQERAAARGLTVEGYTCPAEKLGLPAASVDVAICKHFLRLASDVDAVLGELARVLKPGGRAYIVDFNGEAPRLGATMLRFWIRLTAPKYLSVDFDRSIRTGLPASTLPERLVRAGFREADVLAGGVAYLVRGTR
jgi:ubiquinone/menaquinone biosynthesis C-methylase UbiE